MQLKTAKKLCVFSYHMQVDCVSPITENSLEIVSFSRTLLCNVRLLALHFRLSSVMLVQLAERVEVFRIIFSTIVWLPDGEKFFLKICLFISSEYMNATDGHTDGIGRARWPRLIWPPCSMAICTLDCP